MKHILILITMAAALAGGLSAADRWTLVGHSSRNGYFLDYQSINYHGTSPHDYATFWEKVVESDGKFSVIHMEYDHAARCFRVLSGTDYTADGSTLGTGSPPLEWVEIPPDSFGEAIFDIVFPPRKEAK